MWICLVFVDRRGGCSNVQTSGFCQTGGKGRAFHFLPSTYHWSHRMGNPQKSPGINGQCLITGGLLASCRCFFSKKGGYPISRRGMGFIDTLDTSMVKLMSTDSKPTGIKPTFVFVGVEMRAVYILYIHCKYTCSILYLAVYFVIPFPFGATGFAAAIRLHPIALAAVASISVGLQSCFGDSRPLGYADVWCTKHPENT